MDLFSASLDKVTFANLESFLGLSLPENQRLKEGERIDYKEQVPQDLGDWVTAFANGDGGLIFIGIRSDKSKQNVPVAWNGIPPANDLETQIAAKILSTVRPRPDFKIGSISLNSGNVIAVIRVEEGSYPPYEYEQGGTTKITLRVHDARKSASVRDIEHLFTKRNGNPPLSEPEILHYVNAIGFDCVNGDGIQDLEFQRIVVIPRRRAHLRLDSSLEHEFQLRLLKYSELDQEIGVASRRGDYLQWQSRVSRQGLYWHHLWRLYETGAVAFTGTLVGDFPNGKPVGDLALDLLSMCQLSHTFFKDKSIEGEACVVQMLRTTSAFFLARMPVVGRHDYMATSSILIPDQAQHRPDRTLYYRTVQFGDLAAPHQAVAEILMYNLREIRQARVNYERLVPEIKALRAKPIE